MSKTATDGAPTGPDHRRTKQELAVSLRKVRAALLSLLLLGAVLLPITENWNPKAKDSFPLSYYPMFSRKRPEVVRITHIVGIDPLGGEHPIPYRYAAKGGMNQVRKQLRKAVQNGMASLLCHRAAKRVARKRKGPLADVDTVAIVTGSYRLDDFIAGSRQPESLEVKTLCKVVRSR